MAPNRQYRARQLDRQWIWRPPVLLHLRFSVVRIPDSDAFGEDMQLC